MIYIKKIIPKLYNPSVMDNSDKWRYRVREIHASGMP